MNLNKITPLLLVPEAEPCIRFWVDRLGFEKTMDVPEGNKIGFAILKKGALELMYQTHASVAKDASAAVQALPKGPTFLYVEVDNLDEIITAVKGSEVVMPVRTTFYGSKEIAVKDPAGHVITFAQFAA